MASAMFIHRIAPLERQIEILKELELTEAAEALEQIRRKINIGTIKTVSQLDQALKEAKKFL